MLSCEYFLNQGMGKEVSIFCWTMLIDDVITCKYFVLTPPFIQTLVDIVELQQEQINF